MFNIFFLLMISTLLLSSCDTHTPQKTTEHPKPTSSPPAGAKNQSLPKKNKTLDRDFQKAKMHLKQQLTTLSQMIQSSLENNLHLYSSKAVFPPQDFQEPIDNILKSKYNRGQLAFLGDPFNSPEEIHLFISPSGEFLDKNKELFKTLWKTNPFHEQGILARECGLNNIRKADQEFSKGDSAKAEEQYQSAYALMNIVSGNLPLDTSKLFYESCTNQNLVTGETLTP